MELDVDRLLSSLDIPADGRTFGGKGEQKMAVTGCGLRRRLTVT